MVVYFSTATNRRSRGVLWSIIAPPFIFSRQERPGWQVFAIKLAFFHNNADLLWNVVDLSATFFAKARRL